MTTTAPLPRARIILAAADALEAASDELCLLDSVAGDGDHGLAMATVARAVRKQLSLQPQADLADVLSVVAAAFGDVGGSMGAIGYVMVSAVSTCRASGIGPILAGDVPVLLRAAEASVTDFGGARPGDKTVVDAIAAAGSAAEVAVDRGDSLSQTLLSAANGADEGAASTAAMVASLGRASRLGELSRGSIDAGARSFAIVLRAIALAYQESGGAHD